MSDGITGDFDPDHKAGYALGRDVYGSLERAILTDLIADLRSVSWRTEFGDQVAPIAGPIGHAEARLREVQGE